MQGVLSIDFMIEIEYVTRTEFEVKTMLKYKDLPFGDHPHNEFRIEILGYMIFLNFISLQEGLQMEYREPHLPTWVIIYWVFILKYSWNIMKKSL